jgi:hypothetical protein
LPGRKSSLATLSASAVGGYTICFIIFQPTYVEMLSLPPSTISWRQRSIVPRIFHRYLQRVFNAGYLKPVLLVGCLLQLVGVFLSSLCNMFMGLGFGMVFPPVIAHVSTYHSTKKVLAMSVTSMGSATSDIIFRSSRSRCSQWWASTGR